MELWTLPVTIYEILVDEVWEKDYVSTYEGGETSHSYRYWEELDMSKVANLEIPYVGEEDEIRSEVLVPAITWYLEKNNYLVGGTYIEPDKGGLSYTAYYNSNDCPYLRITLG